MVGGGGRGCVEKAERCGWWWGGGGGAVGRTGSSGTGGSEAGASFIGRTKSMPAAGEEARSQSGLARPTASQRRDARSSRQLCPAFAGRGAGTFAVQGCKGLADGPRCAPWRTAVLYAVTHARGETQAAAATFSRACGIASQAPLPLNAQPW